MAARAKLGVLDEAIDDGPVSARAAMSIPTLVLVYWALSASWIVVTDAVLGNFGDERSGDIVWNIAKGLVFVTVTAGLLLALLRRRQRLLDDERARSAQLEQRLHDAERMDAVGRLAGGVAHDFNNLLAVMRGHLDLARLDATEAQTDSLEMIEEAIARAVDLTGELQTVARRQHLDLHTVDLSETVRHEESVLDAMLPPNVHLVVDCTNEALPVRLDPARFQQVILNLSANARDAMPDGGTLRLSVARNSADAILTVSDTGTGMSTEQLRHCFEPFYTTKPQGKGTGLGLALTYGVVRQSGGEISMTSLLGAGTRVAVALPIVTS